LSPGNVATVVGFPGVGRVGIAICYDLRYPELAAAMVRGGAGGAGGEGGGDKHPVLLVYPGAFNTTTGPIHWELLLRARAVDNQIFVAACSPASPDKNDTGAYPSYGHSLVVDPVGRVLAQAGSGEETIEVDLDPALVTEARTNIPVSSQRRFDVYADPASTARIGSAVVVGDDTS